MTKAARNDAISLAFVYYNLINAINFTPRTQIREDKGSFSCTYTSYRA